MKIKFITSVRVCFFVTILLTIYSCLFGKEMKDLSYIKEQFNKQKDNIERETFSKDRFGKEVLLLSSILKKDLNQTDRDNVLNEILNLPKDDSNADFVLQGLIVLYADTGNREKLVELFSIRCPEKIFLNSTIEFYTGFQCADKFEHPITILFDSYKISESVNCKHDIANAVKRAFCAYPIFLDGDSEKLIIQKAEEWYEDNKNKIEPNINYYHDYMQGKAPCKSSLFKWKRKLGVKSTLDP